MHIVNRKENGWVVFSQMNYQIFLKSLCEVMEPYGYVFNRLTINEYCDAWESTAYPSTVLNFDLAVKTLDGINSDIIMCIGMHLRKDRNRLRVQVDEGANSVYVFDDIPEISVDEMLGKILEVYKTKL